MKSGRKKWVNFYSAIFVVLTIPEDIETAIEVYRVKTTSPQVDLQTPNSRL